MPHLEQPGIRKWGALPLISIHGHDVLQGYLPHRSMLLFNIMRVPIPCPPGNIPLLRRTAQGVGFVTPALLPYLSLTSSAEVQLAWQNEQKPPGSPGPSTYTHHCSQCKYSSWLLAAASLQPLLASEEQFLSSSCFMQAWCAEPSRGGPCSIRNQQWRHLHVMRSLPSRLLRH